MIKNLWIAKDKEGVHLYSQRPSWDKETAMYYLEFEIDLLDEKYGKTLEMNTAKKVEGIII